MQLTILGATIFLFSSLALAQSDHHVSHPTANHAPEHIEKATTKPLKEKIAETHEPHWGYSGKEGPKNWAKLSPEFTACEEGKNQSPINLKWKHIKGAREIVFHYQPSKLEIIDTGHSIQANVPFGSYVTIDGNDYQLVQFHFHSLSEHTFSGKYYPIEVHFVHKDEAGHLAVVGAMYQEGHENTELANVFSTIPKTDSHEKSTTVNFNPRDLLPKIMTHYHYIGSLTTPPCSEGVNWNMLNTPMEASNEQIAHFQSFYSQNNRPIQPIYDRKPANY